MFRTKNIIPEKEYIEKYILLWTKVCREVYLFSDEKIIELSKGGILESATETYFDTNYTVEEAIQKAADPYNVTNQCGHGQKAREKRWKIWLKENFNMIPWHYKYKLKENNG